MTTLVPEHDAPVVCASCASPLSGRFCSDCGEERAGGHDHSLGHFVAHSLHDLTHFDTKIFRTAARLVRRPGELTADYFAGRRRAWLSPVQLFVMVNLLFFFLLPRMGLFRFTVDYFAGNRTIAGVTVAPLLDAARGERSPAEFARDFDEAIDHPKKLLIVLMAVLFAGVLWTVHPRRGMLEHLVFALHFYAFWMLLAMAIPVAAVGIFRSALALGLMGHGRWSIGDVLLVPLMLGLSGAYLYAALRRYYGDGRVAAAARAVLLSASTMLVFVVYRDVVFFVTVALVR